MKKKKSGFLKKLKMAGTTAAMADLAFLLLIFFMAATNTETPKNVAVDLPAARTQGAEQESVFISVTKEEQLYFEGNLIAMEILRKKLNRRQDKKITVALTVDKSVEYRKVSQLINLLKEEGYQKVVFLAQEREHD